MAWTINFFVEIFCGDFLGEVVAEFGDIESGAANPNQKSVTLLNTEEGGRNADRVRAIEAWDYAQQWADRSSRPVRLLISGSIDGGAVGSYGVKTFAPRIKGGTETTSPLPAKSAFSGNRAEDFAVASSDEHGEWQVPYADGEYPQAVARLDLEDEAYEGGPIGDRDQQDINLQALKEILLDLERDEEAILAAAPTPPEGMMKLLAIPANDLEENLFQGIYFFAIPPNGTVKWPAGSSGSASWPAGELETGPGQVLDFEYRKEAEGPVFFNIEKALPYEMPAGALVWQPTRTERSGRHKDWVWVTYVSGTVLDYLRESEL